MSNDELTLNALFEKSIAAITENFKYLIIAFIICNSIALAIYFTTDKVYESQMVASSNNVSDERILDITADLQTLINIRDHKQLAQQLDLDVKTVKKIHGIECILGTEIDKRSNIYDTEVRNYFGIKFLVADLSIIHDVKNAFINHLQSNNYIKTRHEAYKQGVRASLASIDAEIAYQHELKKNLWKLIEGNSSKANVFISDLSDISTNILGLQEKKREYELILAHNESDISVIKDLTTFRKPVSPRLSVALATGTFFSLLLGFTIAVVQKRRKKRPVVK